MSCRSIIFKKKRTSVAAAEKKSRSGALYILGVDMPHRQAIHVLHQHSSDLLQARIATAFEKRKRDNKQEWLIQIGEEKVLLSGSVMLDRSRRGHRI
jgi:hypothetical protein